MDYDREGFGCYLFCVSALFLCMTIQSWIVKPVTLLCAEVTREKSFLFPRPLINLQLLMEANNCTFPSRANRYLQWEQRARTPESRVLAVKAGSESGPPNRVSASLSLVCFCDNTDLVCLYKFLPWANLSLNNRNTCAHGWQFWLPNGWYKTH